MAFRYRITVINPTSTYARSIFHHSSFYLSKNYFLINPSSIYWRIYFHQSNFDWSKSYCHQSNFYL